MINDDTILEPLRWKEFDQSGESFRIADEKCSAILRYIFEEYTDTDFYFIKDGIAVRKWNSDSSYAGIKLDFYNRHESRQFWRIVRFKGTAKDFKAKVLEKFEVLKSLKRKTDEKYINQKRQAKADEIEITELTEIVKKAFDKYYVNISKNSCTEGFTLTLEIDFNDKRELLNFCEKEE